MQIDELRTKNEQELQELLQEMRDKLRKLRFEAAEGALKENHKITQVKKTIARILTLLNEEQND